MRIRNLAAAETEQLYRSVRSAQLKSTTVSGSQEDGRYRFGPESELLFDPGATITVPEGVESDLERSLVVDESAGVKITTAGGHVIHYDSGRRDLSSSGLIASAWSGGTVYARRFLNSVTFEFSALSTTSSGGSGWWRILQNLPLPWRPSTTRTYQFIGTPSTGETAYLVASSGSSINWYRTIDSGGSLTETRPSEMTLVGGITFPCDNALPTSLIGAPA